MRQNVRHSARVLSVDQLLGPAAEANLAAAWRTVWTRATGAWPTLALDERALCAFVLERLAGIDLVSELGVCPAEDLALASACAAGEPAAHQAFETYLTAVEKARVDNAPRHLFDEVKQLLRVQLLVAGEGEPGIIAYRGKGPLRAWLRIIATRELLRLLRGGDRARPAPAPLEELALAASGDLALDQLKDTYRAELAEALRDAIADLSFEDRLLLRQQISDRLSLDEIAAAHGVHRGTASRWLARARAALLASTQRRLGERLDLPDDEVTSVIRLVHSRLDVSVERLLREPARR